MTKASRIFFIIISLLLLATVLFLPMLDEGGGILTKEAEYNFARVIGDLLMEEGTLSLWAVHMTLGVFLPAVVMLATAFTRMRWLYSLSNTLGILVWFFNFFRYALKESIMPLFDIHTTDISIGSWLAVFFFLISALVLLCTKKRKDTDVIDHGRCPECGIKLRRNTNYCPRCGRKLSEK